MASWGSCLRMHRQTIEHPHRPNISDVRKLETSLAGIGFGPMWLEGSGTWNVEPFASRNDTGVVSIENS